MSTPTKHQMNLMETGHRVPALEAENEQLKVQRDALLEALGRYVDNSSVQAGFPDECEQAEATIAKVRGGEG